MFGYSLSRRVKCAFIYVTLPFAIVSCGNDVLPPFAPIGGSGGDVGSGGDAGSSGDAGSGGNAGSGGAGNVGGANGGGGASTGGANGNATGGMSGGAGASGGRGGTSGASGAAGVGGNGGATTGSGGSAGIGGSAGAAAGSGGGAGSGGSHDAGGIAGAGGAIDAGSIADARDASFDGGCEAGDAATTRFSFFVTSLMGLRRLSGNQNGFGGDLRFGKADGISGADEICRQLADASMPGAGCKTWRAFLSATKGAAGGPVHAIERVGAGPWYDRIGRLVAMTKDDLLQPWPRGADPAIIYDLPNEYGVPNHNPDGTGNVDNHNTLTGTGADGKVVGTDWGLTCHDWTSKVGTDGTPRIGFSWLGGAASFPGSAWYTGNFNEAGCAALINLTDINDPLARGVGSQGGYGGFYCLALTP